MTGKRAPVLRKLAQVTGLTPRGPWPWPSVDGRVLARAASGSVVALGLLVLAGWVWEVPFLKGPLPGLVQMKADTAVGFLALGAGLLLRTANPGGGRRRAGGVLAVFACLIGGLTLAEYALGRNLGLDQVLFRDTSAIHTVHPGRLAPQTAFNFVILGLALLLLNAPGRHRRRLVGVLTATAFALALFAVLGYAYGVPGLVDVPSLTPIALHSAIAFLVLCVGVVAADPHGILSEWLGGHASGSLLARKMLPVGLVVFPLLGWLPLDGERNGLYPAATGVALLVLASMIVLALAVLSLSRRLNQVDADRNRALAQARHLATLVDVSNEAIISANVDGLVETWNRAAEELFGYSAPEIIGRPLAVLCPPERREEQQRTLKSAVEDEAGTQIDTERLHKDGSTLDVTLTISAVVEDGALRGFCGVLHDIGHRVRASNELSALLKARTLELDEARLEAFHKLALAAEYRDDETRDHTRRVGEMSAALASELGLDEVIVEIIRQVAPLHDLGKIGIPDSILLKPAKLTEAEFATMREHAQIGAEILAGSDSSLFLVAAEIAGSHHERWDGSGYPRGLAGQEIPIAARIVGLVDAFDAMTHERPYKAAWPLEEALAEVHRCSGGHFDPNIVTAFARLDHAAFLQCKDRASTRLSKAALTKLRTMTPSAGTGVSATDERWIAATFRNATHAMLIADDERRYVAGNNAACHMLGITPDELIGKRIDDFAPPAVRPHLDAVWTDFLKAGTQYAPFTLTRADGVTITVQFTALAHFAPGLHLSMLQPMDDRHAAVHDPARLHALLRTGLLDSPAEEAYDRVTRLVAEQLDVPTALISLVDDDRQFFKSHVGLDEALANERQTPLSHSFCQYAVITNGPVIVPDAHQDPRFVDNPAIRDHDVAAYLGVPIRTADGHVLGSLCAIDTEPRAWTGDQVELLLQLSGLLSDQIQDRRPLGRYPLSPRSDGSGILEPSGSDRGRA